MTLRPAMPRTRSSSSTTGHRVMPHPFQHPAHPGDRRRTPNGRVLLCTANPAARSGVTARLRTAMRWPPQLASLGGHAIPRLIGTLEAGQLGCLRFPPYRIGSVPQRLLSRPPSAIAMTTTNLVRPRRVGDRDGDRVQVRERPGIILVPEWHIKTNAGRGHLHGGPDHRLAAADRRTHRSRPSRRNLPRRLELATRSFADMNPLQPARSEPPEIR